MSKDFRLEVQEAREPLPRAPATCQQCGRRSVVLVMLEFPAPKFLRTWVCRLCMFVWYKKETG